MFYSAIQFYNEVLMGGTFALSRGATMHPGPPESQSCLQGGRRCVGSWRGVATGQTLDLCVMGNTTCLETH